MNDKPLVTLRTSLFSGFGFLKVGRLAIISYTKFAAFFYCYVYILHLNVFFGFS